MAALTEIEPIEKRKEFSRGLIERIAPQSVLQWCFADDGESVFREACKLGFTALCRNGLAQCIAGGGHRMRSRSKIRKHQRSGARPKKIGAANLGGSAGPPHPR